MPEKRRHLKFCHFQIPSLRRTDQKWPPFHGPYERLNREIIQGGQQL